MSNGTKVSTPLETMRFNYKSQLDSASVRRKEAAQNITWAEAAEAQAAKYLEAIEVLEKAGVK